MSMQMMMEDTPIETVPEIENWSENFALAVFDPEHNIHVFLHIGRWRKDTSLWRENVIIALPDGTTVYRRSIGNALATNLGPGGSNLRMTVNRPFSELRWQFLGAAQRVPAKVARENLPQDGPLERLEFDLLFKSGAPMWDIAQMGEKTTPCVRGHTEQIGLIEGMIRVGDETYQFSGMGNRDHTRGPRVQDNSPRRHMWLHGTFENGISFLAYELERFADDAPVMSEACVYDNDRLFPATFAPNFRIPENGLSALSRPFGFEIGYEKRALNIQVTDFASTNFIQFTAPWDLYVGRRQVDDELNRCVAEQAANMQLDGSISGYGHLERSLLGPIIFDPV